MRDYLRTWNAMRLIRQALGIGIIIQGFIMKDWSFVVIGSIFSLMSIFNVGCCATGSCSTPTLRNKNINKTEDISYEEVH